MRHWILAFLCSVFVWGSVVQAMPSVSGYVTDSLGILSPQEKAFYQVIGQLDQVQNSCHCRGGVFGWDSIEEYASRLFESAGIGYSPSVRSRQEHADVANRGVLLLTKRIEKWC